MAAAGIGSRRKCEELILAGRVEVDGRTVTELGTRVDPARHKVHVDGTQLKWKRRLYYLVNKPEGVVSTNDDPSGRTRVIDLVPMEDDHVYTVGRLDRSSEGLILVTSDGELAHRLTHPRFGVEKTYVAQVAGVPEPEVLTRLRKGVHVAEALCRVNRIRVVGRQGQSTVLEIVLSEGRNREIRRILAKVGHKVLRLKRIAIGPIELGALKPGDFRHLSPEEVESLRKASGPGARRRAPPRHGPRPGGPRAPASKGAAGSKPRPGKPRRPARSPADGGNAVQGGRPPRGPRPGGASPGGRGRKGRRR